VLGIKYNFRSKKYCFGVGYFSNNANYQWNPVYNAFHRNCVVETKRFVGSFVNVILTRQRQNRVAESKRQALGNYFCERLEFAIFIISRCRGDRDLGLCTTWVHANGEPKHNGKIRFLLEKKNVKKNVFFLKSPLRLVSPNASTANPTWGDIFESSELKLEARTSLLPRFSEKRRSNFEH